MRLKKNLVQKPVQKVGNKKYQTVEGFLGGLNLFPWGSQSIEPYQIVVNVALGDMIIWCPTHNVHNPAFIFVGSLSIKWWFTTSSTTIL